MASIEQIIARFIKDKNDSDQEHKITKSRLLKSTKVHISNKEYQAVMLETNFGKQIILMQHQKGQGWWTKTFAVEDFSSSIPQSKEIYNGRIHFELPGVFSGKMERNNHAFGFTWEEVATTPRERTGFINLLRSALTIQIFTFQLRVMKKLKWKLIVFFQPY